MQNPALGFRYIQAWAELLRASAQTRYINTSRTGKNNCRGDSTIVNGEARLLVHATKDTRSKLQKNDELLLDYGGNYELFGHEA